MLWAVIMAGGSGTRFWPESREATPKQFLRVFGKKTLLEQTFERLQPLISPRYTLVITQKDKVSRVRTLLKKIQAAHVIGEPVGRNTAPCAVLAARIALEKDPQAVIALLPADHRIEDEPAFRRALKQASVVAQRTGLPVTFGVKPAFAHTGYGYLEIGQSFLKGALPVFRLKCFHEKPDLKRAQRFVKSGRFLWNSGMFVWKASALLEAAQKYLPEAPRIAEKIMRTGVKSGMNRFYAGMPNISIDYALMEPLKGRILACPVDFGWNDVGSWESLRDLHAADKAGNIVLGESLLIESGGNIVKTGKKLTVLLGMKDHLVVDTHDALLICPVSHAQSIRKVVHALKTRKLHRHL